MQTWCADSWVTLTPSRHIDTRISVLERARFGWTTFIARVTRRILGTVPSVGGEAITVDTTRTPEQLVQMVRNVYLFIICCQPELCYAGLDLLDDSCFDVFTV